MSARIPPLQSLRALEAVARTRSLTRAAEALHLTHGAISHQLKALQAELGAVLVERSGRGVRLTVEGERLAARVGAALSEIAAALQEVTDRNGPQLWRVSVMPSFAARWLLPRIGRFLAAHPDVDLDVRANFALVDFGRDDVDVAIRYGSGDYPGLAVEHLMDDIYFPVCSPRFAGGRLPRVPAELAGHLLLRTEKEYWQPWFRAAGLDWPEPVRGPMYNDASHMLQAAIEGQGIALGRSSLMGNDLVNGVLVRLFDVTLESPHRYFLVYPPRLADSPKLMLFRDWLKGEIAVDGGGIKQPARPLELSGKRHKARAR